MSLIWQEKVINSLNENRQYRILWWSFGPTMLEVLCKEKVFNAKELLDSKSNKNKEVEEQCIKLLEVLGEKKAYRWWPWSSKIKDIKINEKQCERAKNYENYSFFWRVIFSLFTSVLVHRLALKRNDLIFYYTRGDSMHNVNISHEKGKGVSNSRDVAKERTHIGRNNGGNISDEKEKTESRGATAGLKHVGSITIGDALERFLPGLLTDLDKSLEKVRRGKKKKKEHEKYCNDNDKKLQKLSLKYHPDRIRNNGGSGEEIATAEEVQKTLNAVRVVIKGMNKYFCRNIDVDYRYSFYAKMEVNSLGNDAELKRMNFKTLTKLTLLSEIKQEKIIANINKFLNASRLSMESFIAKDSENFKKNRDLAFLRLGCCVSGYNELVKEFELIIEECRKDKELSNIKPSVYQMLRKSAKQLDMLKNVNKIAIDSLQGKFQSLKICKDTDEYFVLPFVEYVNILLTCSNIIEKRRDKKSWLGKKYEEAKNFIWGNENSEKGEILEDYNDAYYLMCYFDGKNKYTDERKKPFGDHQVINDTEVEKAFFNRMVLAKKQLEERFKPECYVEGGVRKKMVELIAKVDAEVKRTEDNLAKLNEAIVDREQIKADREQIKADNLKFKAEIINLIKTLHPKAMYTDMLQQQELSICSTDTQQQGSNTQAANDLNVPGSNVPLMSCNRSQRLSSSSNSRNGNHTDPSSKLSEVQSISCSHSLSPLRSNGSESDIEIVRMSQCR